MSVLRFPGWLLLCSFLLFFPSGTGHVEGMELNIWCKEVFIYLLFIFTILKPFTTTKLFFVDDEMLWLSEVIIIIIIIIIIN